MSLSGTPVRRKSPLFDLVGYEGGVGSPAAPQQIRTIKIPVNIAWIKDYDDAGKANVLFDDTRGATKYLEPASADAEATDTQTLTAFVNGGFNTGESPIVNDQGDSHIAWCWNVAPHLGSYKRTYTGNGSNRTLTHDTGGVPECMWFKPLGAGQWAIYHKDMTSAAAANESIRTWGGATSTGSNIFNQTSPAAANFSLGTNALANDNGVTFEVIMFRSVPGLSKIGTYTGNGSTTGPVVDCGFRPRLVLLCNETDNAVEFYAWDSVRGPTSALPINDNTPAGIQLDFLSNGFQPRSTNNVVNANGDKYIFLAFA